MSRLILFNKPFGVLTQFTDRDARPTLGDFIPVKNVYAAGRLDADSEGLVLLTDDGGLQARISHPRHKLPKCYRVQVEGVPTDGALQTLEKGVDLGDFLTKPCRAYRIVEPENLWARDPPVRHRAAIPTSWLELTLFEGKNRQVRRMTASVGYPTLRLVRWSVGDFTIDGLAPGEWRETEIPDLLDTRRRDVKGYSREAGLEKSVQQKRTWTRKR